MFFAAQGLEEHLAADGGEDGEGDPVNERPDVGGQGPAGHPANHGHEELEQAEVEGEPEHVAVGEQRDDEAGGDGHGKRVHGQTDCQTQLWPKRSSASPGERQNGPRAGRKGGPL